MFQIISAAFVHFATQFSSQKATLKLATCYDILVSDKQEPNKSVMMKYLPSKLCT